MFGWFISASAWRSASKRAMTSRVSMPGLDHLERDLPADGLLLLRQPDLAHAAFADEAQQAIRSNVRRRRRADGGRRVASGSGRSREWAACS